MIFLEPQFRNDNGEILNVVNSEGNAVGYLSYMFKDEGDLYILGQLEEEGEKQNFLDVTSHFIDGLRQSVVGDHTAEPYVYIHLGGEMVQLEKGNKSGKTKDDDE